MTPLGLQRLQPARAGRWRQADPAGEIDRRHAAVDGERGDDLAVESIHLHEITVVSGHSCTIYASIGRVGNHKCTETPRKLHYYW